MELSKLFPREVAETLKRISETEPGVLKGDSMQRTILLEEYIEKLRREYPQRFRPEGE
jgi:hypothetical protein